MMGERCEEMFNNSKEVFAKGIELAKSFLSAKS